MVEIKDYDKNYIHEIDCSYDRETDLGVGIVSFDFDEKTINVNLIQKEIICSLFDNEIDILILKPVVAIKEFDIIKEPIDIKVTHEISNWDDEPIVSREYSFENMSLIKKIQVFDREKSLENVIYAFANADDNSTVSEIDNIINREFGNNKKSNIDYRDIKRISDNIEKLGNIMNEFFDRQIAQTKMGKKEMDLEILKDVRKILKENNRTSL